MRLYQYIGRHWAGELSLARAFWLNFVVVYIVLNAVERFLFPPYIVDEIMVATAFTVHVVAVKLIVYTWQVVGLLRTCARKIRDDVGRLWAMITQLLVAASLVSSCVLFLDSYHVLELYRERQAYLRTPPEKPLYTLELGTGRRQVRVELRIRAPETIEVRGRQANAVVAADLKAVAA